MKKNGGLARRKKGASGRPTQSAEPQPAPHHKITYKERRWAR